MTIGITGATGQLGQLVVRGLLETTRPEDLVLTSRSPEDLEQIAPTVPAAQRRRADFADPASLESAFTGVDTLLLISTDVVGEQRRALQRAAVSAAAAAGVQRIVYTSVPRPDADNPAIAATDHRDTEQAIVDSGLSWTFLRNNLYSDMQRASLDQAAASGQFITNIGEGRNAYVSRADCAAVAVAALTGSGHENQAYDVTGPQAFGASDLAELAGRISDGPVEVVQVDDAAYNAGLVSVGLPQPVADVLTTFGAATRGGWLSDISTAVEDLTGHAPQPLTEVAGLA